MARHYTDASSVQKFAKAQISGRNISCASTTKVSSVVNVTWCFQLNQRDRHTNIGSTRLKLCATTVVERTLEINKRGTFYGTIPQTKKGPFNAYYVTQSRDLQLNKLMMTITTFMQEISLTSVINVQMSLMLAVETFLLTSELLTRVKNESPRQRKIAIDLSMDPINTYTTS